MKRNGKKFITVIVGGLCITVLAAMEQIDPMIAVLYWFGAGGVTAGSISRKD